MATSGTSTFRLEVAEIIDEAYERCGRQPASLQPYEVRSIRKSLNLIFSDWSNRGVNLFTVEQTIQSISAAQTNFELPAGTIDVLECALRRDGKDYLMTRLSRGEYLAIHDKNQQDMPQSFWVDRQYTPKIYFWPTDSSSSDSIVLYRWCQIEDASALAQNVDLPYRWSEAVCAALAVRVAVKVNALDRMEILMAQAADSFAAAITEDRERGPMRFVPQMPAAWSGR